MDLHVYPYHCRDQPCFSDSSLSTVVGFPMFLQSWTFHGKVRAHALGCIGMTCVHKQAHLLLQLALLPTLELESSQHSTQLKCLQTSTETNHTWMEAHYQLLQPLAQQTDFRLSDHVSHVAS